MKGNSYNLPLSKCSFCKKQEGELKTKPWGNKEKCHKECLLSFCSYVRFRIRRLQGSQNEKELPEEIIKLMYYNSGNARVGFNDVINRLDKITENIMWNW